MVPSAAADIRVITKSLLPLHHLAVFLPNRRHNIVWASV